MVPTGGGARWKIGRLGDVRGAGPWHDCLVPGARPSHRRLVWCAFQLQRKVKFQRSATEVGMIEAFKATPLATLQAKWRIPRTGTAGARCTAERTSRGWRVRSPAPPSPSTTASPSTASTCANRLLWTGLWLLASVAPAAFFGTGRRACNARVLGSEWPVGWVVNAHP